MSEIRVTATNGPGSYRTNIHFGIGGHALIADEPSEFGGNDAGPESHSLLASSLATCIAMTLRMYADRKQWPLEEILVAVTLTKEGAGDAQHTRFQVELDIKGPLDEDQHRRLMEIAGRCPVHRILTHPIEISISGFPLS
jgi:putative redox protein